MRILRFAIYWAVFLSIPAMVAGQARAAQTGDLVRLKLSNSLNLLLQPVASSGNVEITLFVKSGSVYEPDSMNGIANLIENILAEKITSYLRKGVGVISFQNTSFDAYATTERTVFKLITSTANTTACLGLLRDSVLGASVSGSEVTRSVNAILQKLEDNKRNNKKVFKAEMIQMLYPQDHEKLEPYGRSEVLKSLGTGTVSRFYKKYFVSDNSILTIVGNVDATALKEQCEVIFKPLFHGEFDPEAITKVHPIRPIAFTKQFILEDTTSTPEFEVCWQFPGTGSARQASYCGFLVNTMLNDKNNFIHIKATKMGCKRLNVQYEANIFNGVLRITFQPSKQNFFSTYHFIVNELSRLDKTLFNDETINVAKLEFRQEFANLKRSKEFPANVAKSWNYNDATYFEELGDSVYNVTQKNLRSFIIDYLDQEPHVSGLMISKADRQSMQVDTGFAELDESVNKYVFKYRQNVTDLEGSENDMMLKNLLQWLKINDDVSLQINGFSDEHEYNRVSDDSVVRFIDSIPTFFKTMPETIKKGYLRPEMMRAMKIVKYLYEQGIDAKRLSGTCMMFKSANKQEEMDNMKCTLTLNKYHKSPSLYEYHYGKKKGEE